MGEYKEELSSQPNLLLELVENRSSGMREFYLPNQPGPARAGEAVPEKDKFRRGWAVDLVDRFNYDREIREMLARLALMVTFDPGSSPTLYQLSPQEVARESFLDNKGPTKKMLTLLCEKLKPKIGFPSEQLDEDGIFSAFAQAIKDSSLYEGIPSATNKGPWFVGPRRRVQNVETILGSLKKEKILDPRLLLTARLIFKTIENCLSMAKGRFPRARLKI